MVAALLAAAGLILLVSTVTMVRVLQLGDAIALLQERVTRLEMRPPRRA